MGNTQHTCFPRRKWCERPRMRVGFSGFGTFDEGARVFQVSATSYRVDSADGNISQVFVLQNYAGAPLTHQDDYYFV